MPTIKNKNLVLFVVIFFVTSVLQYSLSLGNGFVWDAEVAFTEDPTIRKLSDLDRAFTEPPFKNFPVEGQNLGSLEYYRPLIKTLHIFEYQVFADNPVGYKAVNILLNAIVVALFFVFVLSAIKNIYVAVPATALYAVNPARAEAVYWTYADGYLIAALFCLIALIAYQRDRLWLALLAFTMALLSHETAIMLPMVVLLYAWLIEQRIDWKGYVPAFAFFGVILIYIAIRTMVIGSVPFTQLEPLTWLNSVVVMLQRFVKIFFIPDATITLYPDYFFSEFTIEVMVSYLMLAVFIGVGVFLFYKRRNYLFWYLWFFVWLAVSFNLGEFGSFLMSDKILYLAAGGFAVIIGLIANEFSSRQRKTAYVLIGVLAAVHAGMVFAKGPYWRNTKVYLEKAIEFTPGFYLAHYSLGYAYVKEQDYDRALAQFNLTIEADPAFSLAHNNIGNIYFMKREYDKALVSWQRAIETDPANPMPYYNVGLILQSKGDIKGALIYFDNYLKNAASPDPRAVMQIQQLRARQTNP